MSCGLRLTQEGRPGSPASQEFLLVDSWESRRLQLCKNGKCVISNDAGAACVKTEGAGAAPHTGRLATADFSSNDPDPVTSELIANNNLEEVTQKKGSKNKSLQTTTKDQRG